VGNRLKATPEELRLALDGKLSDIRRSTLVEALDQIRSLEVRIADLDRILLITLAPYQKQLDPLQTIPGVALITAALLLVEIGPDMEVFKTPERIASLAALCPGNNESAGKKHSGRTRKGNRWLRRTLCEAVHVAVRTECAFKAKFKDLIRRRGYKRSIVDTASKILRVAFAILKKEKPYKDCAVDYEALMVKKNASRWIRALKDYRWIPDSVQKLTEPIQPGSGVVKRKRGRPRKVTVSPEEPA
jgi:transposase